MNDSTLFRRACDVAKLLTAAAATRPMDTVLVFAASSARYVREELELQRELAFHRELNCLWCGRATRDSGPESAWLCGACEQEARACQQEAWDVEDRLIQQLAAEFGS